MNLKTARSIALVLFLSRMAAPAAALVYESFNYGGTGGAISGTIASGTGLTGSYNTTITGGASATYVTNSLVFSNNFFASQGGALTLSLTPNNNATNEAGVAGVSLNAGTLTGSVYSSYLFKLSSDSTSNSSDSIGTRLANTQNTGGASSRFNMFGDSGNSANNMAVSYASSTSAQTGTAGTLALSADGSTTYLMIGKWTNVGAAGGGISTMWVLTSSAYDNWLSLGNGLETNLDTYATAKTQRAETTQIDFDDSTFLQFTIGEGTTTSTGTLTGTFDELRFGVDLAAVAVPEPSTYTMLGMGFLALCVSAENGEIPDTGVPTGISSSTFYFPGMRPT